MTSEDIADIVERARKLRNQEIARVEDLLVARLSPYLQRLAFTLGDALLALSKLLRPLFSWNPAHRHS